MKAPFTAPNSSEADQGGEIAPRLTATKGPERRGLASWRARATSSLPVPVSPRSSTGTSRSATRRMSQRTAAELVALADQAQRGRTARPGSCGAASGAAGRRGRPAPAPRRARCPPRRTPGHPTSGVPSTSTRVRLSSCARMTPFSAPGRNRSGWRLMCWSPSGRPAVRSGEVNSGECRESSVSRPRDTSLRAVHSPTRRKSGWKSTVSAGTEPEDRVSACQLRESKVPDSPTVEPSV